MQTTLTITIKKTWIQKLEEVLFKFINLKIVFLLSTILITGTTIILLHTDKIVLYGDAESHLNIAKRVVNSLTPGAGQLGGVWLPLPHILMIPFVYFDFLWQTGLAGSIVSGSAYIISCIYIFKILYLVTKNKFAGFFAFLIFGLNPNVLYMSATPMTESLLISLFIISSYFYIKFIKDTENLSALILSAAFGFLASITRYEGWFLVAFEALGIIILHIRNKKLNYKPMEGKIVIFSTLAFFGILLWFLWDFLILGDPLYFTNSPFSAKSQQSNWLRRGELPSYNNVINSISYYTLTSLENIGFLIFVILLIGLFHFLTNKENPKEKFLISLLFLVPWFFYCYTLFIGQSVIFIPELTPANFEWKLFNVRYGLMMLPGAAFFSAWLFAKSKSFGKILIMTAFVFQLVLFASGQAKVITFEDGNVGLSHAKRPDAESWLANNYDKGLVLIDDYARTASLVRSHIPMQNFIYIGNQYYWSDSLKNPEKWATWIVMQKGDTVWKNLYDNKQVRGQLYAHFNKAYTSKEILIFKKYR